MRKVLGLALVVAALGCDDNANAPADLACANSCIDDTTTSLTCNSNGFGYAATACPTGTQCGPAGQCAGSCVVGFTACDATLTMLLTCADGFSFTPSACPTGTLCTTDNSKP